MMPAERETSTLMMAQLAISIRATTSSQMGEQGTSTMAPILRYPPVPAILSVLQQRPQQMPTQLLHRQRL